MELNSPVKFCCEEANKGDPINDVAFFDAVERIAGDKKKIVIQVLKCLIKQKDIIINKLR